LRTAQNATIKLLIPVLMLLLVGLAMSVHADEIPECATLQGESRIACQDSVIAATRAELARRDSLLREQSALARNGGIPDEKAADENTVADERTRHYFLNFVGDWGMHGLGGKDLAEAVYVVAAIVAVGGTLIYLPVVVYKLIRNQEKDPVHHELGASYLYSGTNWQGGGEPLYRNTHMPGLRYTALIAHPVVGLGLTLEGGYLAPDFEGSLQVTDQIDLHGAYGLIGPILRFWPRNRVTLAFEFLNGTSTSPSVGWVTKARINAQMKFGPHAFVGLNMGSLFYDLHFFDGTVWRQGAFNRDLALTLGFEAGYAF
jgi:hypothetical protein